MNSLKLCLESKKSADLNGDGWEAVPIPSPAILTNSPEAPRSLFIMFNPTAVEQVSEGEVIGD